MVNKTRFRKAIFPDVRKIEAKIAKGKQADTEGECAGEILFCRTKIR